MNGRSVAATRTGSRIIAVVGQIPPPVNGQALMIQQFLQGSYTDIVLLHVPMQFSRSNKEVGIWSWRKVAALISTLFRILEARFRHGARVLYYPPAGANFVPVVRDLFLLSLSRPFFPKTVFHFHAAGLGKIYARLPALFRPIYRFAYGKPDLAIFTTQATSAEAFHLKALDVAIVPCGTPDVSQMAADSNETKHLFQQSPKRPTILFAGILCEGKGVLVLIEACRRLCRAGVEFDAVLMGEFQTPEFETTVRELITISGLDDSVHFPGIVTGNAKYSAFQTASIFCFPSHYPAESFGVVLIEAMSFSLPIVATDWQGIPEVIGRGGEGALLVPVRDAEALSTALASLLSNSTRRESMGAYNRRRYLSNFTVSEYRNNLAVCLLGVM